MRELFQNLVFAKQFVPHGHCYLWQPELVWLHVVADALIALAYYSIPLMLLYLVQKRRDLPFDWAFLLFGSFIVACGTSHVMAIITLWHPVYWLAGGVKAITALISISTAIAMVFLVPQALALPSSAQLAAANRALVNEIAERKQIEKVLESQAEKLQAQAQLLELAHDTIMVRTMDNAITFWNHGAEEMYGWKKTEVLGKISHSFLATEFPQPLAEIEAALLAQDRWEGELWHTKRDGTRIIVSSRWALKRDQQGLPQEVLEINNDITERKRTEEALAKSRAELEIKVQERTAELTKTNNSLQAEIEQRQQVESALRESEQRYRFLAEVMPQIVWIAAPDGRVTYYNQRWYDYTGMTFDQTKDLRWLPVLHPDDRHECIQQWTKAIQTGEIYEIEYRFRRAKDGAYRWHLGRALPMRDAEGNILLWAGTATDIDDQKRTQEQLKASLKEKEVLVQEIHHRVKNNLQIISSLLKLQSEHIHDPKDLEMFKISQNRIETIALIHEKLYRSEDLAHIEFSEYIQDLIFNLFCSYEVSLAAIEPDIKVERVNLGINEAIPCGLIINELVLNSLKHAFSPAIFPRKIYVELYKCENKYVLIIGDNGIGFPSHIDFKKTDSLGLQIVNALVNQIGGNIELDNQIGTKFKITFTA